MDIGVARAVAAAYGLGEPRAAPVAAGRGERGRVWRLATDRGSWAVKESTAPDVDEAAAARDVAFQEAAAAAGVPLPRPVRAADGRVLLTAAGTVRVYEWVDLAPTGGAPDVAGDLGAVAATLHRLAHPADGPVHPWYAEPLGPAGWAALHESAARAAAWWAAPLGRLLPDLTALDAVVTPPDPAATVTCHRDLNVENVLPRRAGGTVVLDWENCGPLEPARELGVVVVHLREDVSEGAALTAYRGYVEAGGPARVTSPADLSTAVVLQGHLLRYYGGLALDARLPAADRDRYDRRVRAALARPLTPAVLDRLLAAVASYA